MKMRKFLLYFLVMGTLTTGCKSEKETKVDAQASTVKKSQFKVFDNAIEAERKAYIALGLDDTCPNLLDPRISKDDITKIKSAWLDLNQNLGKFLAENDFTWGMKGVKVKVWHKFYFEKDGELKAYFFNVLDKNIESEKREAYKKRVLDFAKNYKLPLTKESTFAQCGTGIFDI